MVFPSRRAGVVALALVVCCLLADTSWAAKPNIIFILADDK